MLQFIKNTPGGTGSKEIYRSYDDTRSKSKEINRPDTDYIGKSKIRSRSAYKGSSQAQHRRLQDPDKDSIIKASKANSRFNEDAASTHSKIVSVGGGLRIDKPNQNAGNNGSLNSKRKQRQSNIAAVLAQKRALDQFDVHVGTLGAERKNYTKPTTPHSVKSHIIKTQIIKSLE